MKFIVKLFFTINVSYYVETCMEVLQLVKLGE